MNPYYQRHVFVCCNQRPAGKTCCASAVANASADDMLAYMKDRVKALRLSGKGDVRINRAGCLGRCEEGPCLVIYPEGVWYRYSDVADIDAIIDQHLAQGSVVERLKI